MTSRKKLVAGNWKMHGSCELVTTMVHAIQQYQAQHTVAADIALFPPAIYLPLMAQQCANTAIAYGAQNISEHEKGAYTGELAISMLAELGCQYVILGHSERRALYGETSAIIAQKVARTLTTAITPIICIGETLAEYEADATLKVLHQQLQAILDLPQGIQTFERAVIAYEPVWAIGTGKTATPEQAQNVHSKLREFLAQYSAAVAEHVKILYGGSVKPDNAAALAAMPDIDGFLVGGAALDPQQFISIISSVK